MTHADRRGRPVIDAEGRPTTLLLVEDLDSDASYLDAILAQVAPTAFAVTRANTLSEATAYLETRTADCAVVDVGLGDADRNNIIEALAARSPNLAFVALTNRDDDEVGVATIHAGAIDFLSKRSLEARVLVASVRHAILLKRFEAALDEAQSIAQVGSWEVDVPGNAVSWSHELYRVLGIDPETKPSFGDLIDGIHPDDRESTIHAIRATAEEFAPFEIEHRVVRSDGSERWIRTRGRAEVGADGRAARLLGTAQDITQLKTAEAAIVHQALHDPLSGLPNRRLLVDRLDQALIRLAREPSIVCLIHFDIDRFKVINDNLGRSVGDALLRATAIRLRHLTRPEDTLARLDSDEFVLLCERVSDHTEAIAIADRVCAAMTEPFAWAGGDLVISVSAGIALASSAAVDADVLLRDADAAMYRAKREGRARSVLFAETMRVNGAGRLATETSLRHSISNGDLRVLYQPIVTLPDGRILGHEALVRWEHPTRGLLQPDEFIPIAEESGLIVPLGAWVLREACHQAKRFQDHDPRWQRLTMSVNVSGIQLGQPDLVELISSALERAGLSSADLQLEMTENVLMDDAASTITVLEQLHDLGVRLGIDDFGTGYSSLAYLRRFPVDVLKIDHTFVDGLGKDLEDSAIVAAIVSLADTLGFNTIAEGVETELQRDCLVDLGCSRAQGYLFARPVTATEAEDALDHAAATHASLA
jgi:diguanylate cyclase (GGDEF)-like protein/PAS domain S-box-containing protein